MNSLVRMEPQVCVLMMTGGRLLVARPQPDDGRHGEGLVLPAARMQPEEPPPEAARRALWEQVGLFHAGPLYPLGLRFIETPCLDGDATRTYRCWHLVAVPPPEPLPEAGALLAWRWRFAEVRSTELAPPFARVLRWLRGEPEHGGGRGRVRALAHRARPGATQAVGTARPASVSLISSTRTP